ncbi:hypothetical protein HYH03_000828 [Edaphochlamys debaryana]|uniref:Uncharacterized protein n=1 Tax=Edaphochlamys debaryana TaxID=47281 RepID=A0A835YFX7_9CHLO|nr:hypothetical protein HYH03_000828 [Edaphochlamys debaryana]|eukprot:KAG2501007.1 hypothetical protein HYH03_000828 [Edaphochlamys debaryana]
MASALSDLLPRLRLQAPGSGEEGSAQGGGRRLRGGGPDEGSEERQLRQRLDVLVPTVWHFLSYRDDDGSLGPPGIRGACAAAARMTALANQRLAGSGFAVAVRECRADPEGYRYLLKPSRDAWLACAPASGDYFYAACGSIIRPSVVDFPRSINIYVAGEMPPSTMWGYGFVPGAADDPFWGHIGLLWDTVTPDSQNSPDAYESGAFTLLHELLHHWGLPHTFPPEGIPANTSCEQDADASRGVRDTPTVSAPVWTQPWATAAFFSCLRTWEAPPLQGDWGASASAASARAAAAGFADDQLSRFDSCPQRPGFDQLGNYMTYSWPVCLAALGHVTPDQVALMHAMTAHVNPDM